MLKFKFQRVGRKKQPSFRIVVTDGRRGPKSNKHTEIVGSYNPITKVTELKEDRIKYWLGEGVIPTDVVYNLFVTNRIIEGEKKNVLPKKTPIQKEEENVEAEERNQEVEAEEKTEETAEATA